MKEETQERLKNGSSKYTESTKQENKCKTSKAHIEFSRCLEAAHQSTKQELPMCVLANVSNILHSVSLSQGSGKLIKIGLMTFLRLGSTFGRMNRGWSCKQRTKSLSPLGHECLTNGCSHMGIWLDDGFFASSTTGMIF